jgi:class 3 adenylate cyclase
MQKLLRSRPADSGRDQDAGDAHAAQLPGTLDRTSRTFVCAVLFLDIVEYSKKPVSEQLKIKEKLTARISQAIRDIPVDNRIILDTGEGVAVNFLDDPEEALFVALELSQGVDSAPHSEPRVELRIGVNFGPVRLVQDGNGQPNIIGDGISVAERVMSFARSGQVLVSRSYYEVITGRCEDYARLFAYQGSRTDKHVREHEIYEVAGSGSEALDLATHRHRARPAGRPQSTDAAGTSRGARWLANRTLAYGAAMLSVATLLAAAIVLRTSEPGDTAADVVKPPAAPVMGPPQPPPPPVVAEAPAVIATAPEPVQLMKSPAIPEDNDVRKPTHPAAKAKVRKPASRTAGAVATRPKPRPAAPVQAPLKAPIQEERAPVSTSSSSKAATGPTALITLAISPWGEVVVDGKSVGVSPPLSELELAPGHHRIEIRNGGFKPYLESFELEPNQTVRIKYKFKEG